MADIPIRHEESAILDKRIKENLQVSFSVDESIFKKMRRVAAKKQLDSLPIEKLVNLLYKAAHKAKLNDPEYLVLLIMVKAKSSKSIEFFGFLSTPPGGKNDYLSSYSPATLIRSVNLRHPP